VSRSDGTYGLSTGYVFVLVEIENLFEHFGNEIPETPPPTITKVIPTDNTTGQNTVSLDTLPSIVDTRFLRRCSPFVDDMYRLLSSFNNDIMRGKEGGGNTRRSSLTPRKIRSFPSPISPLTMRSPSDDPRSKFFSENEMKSVQRSLSALSSESNTQTPTKRELAKMRKEAATLRVLTNTFLHHHWQLRTTVEFLSNVLAQNSRDVVNDSVKTVIRSALNINKDDEISHDDARRICKDVSNESDLVDLVNVTVITCMSSAMTDVRKYCHERASTAIRCMAKKDLPEAVLKTAVEIAENRASTSARLLVMSTVRLYSISLFFKIFFSRSPHHPPSHIEHVGTFGCERKYGKDCETSVENGTTRLFERCVFFVNDNNGEQSFRRRCNIHVESNFKYDKKNGSFGKEFSKERGWCE